MGKYYAVRVGKIPGIYRTWQECKDQVHGFKGAEYKSFKSQEDAENYIKNERKLVNIDDDTLISYVDGSFDLKDRSYSYGAVMIKDNNIETYSKRYPENQFSDHRNVSGEIEGAIFSMDYSIRNGYKSLILHYDYVGIEKWALGEWKTNNDLTKNYKSYYDSIKDKLEVEFVKVAAHSGDKYNDMADQLAKDAKIEA